MYELKTNMCVCVCVCEMISMGYFVEEGGSFTVYVK